MTLFQGLALILLVVASALGLVVLMALMAASSAADDLHEWLGRDDDADQ